MPPIDQPPAADGADSRRTSKEQQLIVGRIVMGGAALVVLAAMYLTFNWALGSPIKLYLVASGAAAVMWGLGMVINRYAPPPKGYAVRQIANEGPAWAIARLLQILIYCVGLGFMVDDATRNPWDIWKAALALLFVGLIVLWSQELFRWVKAWRAGRDQGRTEL